MSLPFFQFIANLEQFRRRIPEAQSAKLIFSSIVTFYLTKTENRTKKAPAKLSHYYFESKYYFGQKTLMFCKKNVGMSKLKSALVLKGKFSEISYVCVLMCQICLCQGFQHNSNKFQTGGSAFHLVEIFTLNE